jgi:hypothetical protein
MLIRISTLHVFFSLPPSFAPSSPHHLSTIPCGKQQQVYWATVKKTYCSKGRLLTAAAAAGGGDASATTAGAGAGAADGNAVVGAKKEEEGQEGAGGEVVDEAAFGVLKRDVTLLTASHFFTIVPLHETRPRQLRYLQQARKLLREEGLLQ